MLNLEKDCTNVLPLKNSLDINAARVPLYMQMYLYMCEFALKSSLAFLCCSILLITSKNLDQAQNPSASHRLQRSQLAFCKLRAKWMPWPNSSSGIELPLSHFPKQW